MDEKLQVIIDDTADKFKLENHTLKRHHIFREEIELHETSYIFNMEWVPNDAEEFDEDYNPPGTVSIDVDLESKLVKRIIFVDGVNKTEAEFPPAASTELTIEWIEEQTGLEFGRQFKLVHEEEKELLFQAAVDNVAVFPSGSIEVEYNEEGKLSLFSIDGFFPNEDQLNWEPFSLTAELVKPIAKKQCKLLEIPLEDKEKWESVYGTATVFVSNDGKRTLSFDEVERPNSYIDKDTVIEWQEPLREGFTKRPVDLSLEATPEEVFSTEKSTNKVVLTVDDQQQAEETSRNFLRSEFPEESGQWKLSGLWPEKGYIFAELKPAAPDVRVIDRRIKLIIDKNTYQPVDYIDNSVIVDMFEHFEKAAQPKLTSEEAFEKLQQHIEITPVYVFDKKQNKYILCGKIDCAYGVDAVTGDVVMLDEL
ncbi:hypothetical protein [Oceanobacillus saliphilus]|uniref:hypothetical protein n=1 Tax=Oceanobacillus saliphilus TaxID=2925834 RepID=UPI00201E1067|nr:hypothetical protein [Oceanobacillus saliphilus]